MPAPVFCQQVKRGQLDCLAIRHPLFQADILLQGAQLIYFRPTDDPQPWLWLSRQAEYIPGQAVRGGIPVCWPWFGQADKNPAEVQQHINDISSASAHGFARQQIWQLKQLQEKCDQVRLTLELESQHSEQWRGHARASLCFTLRRERLEVALTSHNLSDKTLHISQALHSYLPTGDIRNSYIRGLEQCAYRDALQLQDGDWRLCRQRGAVSFAAETDRIYFLPQARPVRLQTPARQWLLSSHGSRSCVVWNPWIDKSRRLSQFADDDYQRMLCIETANVMDDIICLPAGRQHTTTLTLQRG